MGEDFHDSSSLFPEHKDFFKDFYRMKLTQQGAVSLVPETVPRMWVSEQNLERVRSPVADAPHWEAEAGGAGSTFSAAAQLSVGLDLGLDLGRTVPGSPHLQWWKSVGSPQSS